MDPKKLNSYVGVVNQPPPKWSSVKKWLLHINYAPGYAPEPEQKPVCRQFSRCEDCPYPSHGFLCWSSEDDCMRTRMKKLNGKGTRHLLITADMIGRNVDLLELNLLALRLTMLGEDDRMGLDGLLQIEKENHTAPFPLSRLINLTFNADICLLAPQVSDTQELGALLYEGEMLSEEAMALVDTMEEDSSFRERLLELLGEQHQEEHSGVFTSRGYAEPGSDFKEVYRKGEMFCFARPSAPVVLEVRKGFFDDPSYDNDKTTILNLPASDADIWRAVGEVDAASLDECAFRCIDCEVPSLRDAVDDAIEQEGGIGMASEFAANLAQKKQSWHEADWVKYKALLSVAGCPSLQDAIQLMHGLDDYDLRPDVAATWDYAEVVLREKYPDLPEELFQTPQAAMVGRQMLEENHAAITDYGLFRRKDNGQLPVFQREPQAMDSPQMGGM